MLYIKILPSRYSYFHTKYLMHYYSTHRYLASSFVFTGLATHPRKTEFMMMTRLLCHSNKEPFFLRIHQLALSYLLRGWFSNDNQTYLKTPTTTMKDLSQVKTVPTCLNHSFAYGRPKWLLISLYPEHFFSWSKVLQKNILCIKKLFNSFNGSENKNLL